MQKYSCPKCKTRLNIQKTFNKKILVSCHNCKLEDLLDYSQNIDEVILDFACKFDKGKIRSKGQLAIKFQKNKMLQDEEQIKKMIGKNKIDALIKQVLFSKIDYISHYTRIKKPASKMGSKVSDFGLDKQIVDHLQKIGIDRFYPFQEDAITEIIYGNNIIIKAPTASGKTEAFLIPIIQKIKTQRENVNKVVAVFVYPTKSLALDQFTKINAFAQKTGINAAVFDGDTDKSKRKELLEHPPQIIITNFDILHYHLLYRTDFASLLNQIQFLVVDETHIYSGIFGSNVYYIIKRLKRMTKKIQFVAASATLYNAKEFCEKLFDVKMTVIKGAGNKSETDFVMIFPSFRTQRALMVDLTKKLTAKKHKTIVFSNSHRNSELLAIQARKKNINIKVHRAGLMVNYRRTVERAFKENLLDVISCTPTLELGIDIGNVDGVISSIIPINRLIQRIGRAGRKRQRGYAFLALGNDPISQYYKNHPNDYFEDVEKMYIDPKNMFIEEFQILAMAYDKPISKHELNEHKHVIQKHLKEKNLILKESRYVPNYDKTNKQIKNYSIRGIGSTISIFLDEHKVGDRTLPIALEELHKDAIYFLAGVKYQIKECGYPEKKYVKLKRIPKDHPYYTKALTEERPTIKTIYEQKVVFGMQVAFCKLYIQKNVYGYVNIKLGEETTQGEKIQLERSLKYDFITKGIVFHAPRPENEICKTIQKEYLEASSYHATEHVIIEGSNMIIGGASQDLGGVSFGTSGMIFVYDGAIGGNGASKVLYDKFEKVLKRSMSIIKECACKNESGCPRCTFSYRCGNNNEFLHKRAAFEVLKKIIAGQRTEIEKFTDHDKPLV